MKFQYYADTDSLYIDLADRPGAEAREVAPGVILDFDDEGKLVGIGIDQARRIADLSELQAVALLLAAGSLLPWRFLERANLHAAAVDSLHAKEGAAKQGHSQ